MPLLPRLADRYGLSDASSAFVLALPGLAMLAVSLPAGPLADRFGARRVTLAAAALLVAGCLGQRLGSLAALLGGRLGYGLSYGALWSAGAAWLTELGGADGERGSAGGLAQSTGPRLDYLAAIVPAAAIAALLALACRRTAQRAREVDSSAADAVGSTI